jgi:hypothetical protein
MHFTSTNGSLNDNNYNKYYFNKIIFINGEIKYLMNIIITAECK